MKKVILFVSVIFLFVSCNENNGIDVPTSDSINEIKVEKLFVVDGITVYRFYDGGTDGEPLIKNVKILKKLQLWKQKI